MPDELASLDGLIAPAAETTIPVTDEGFLRGDGVFEVIRVYDGVPFALDEHLTRLERSTTNLRLGWSARRDELEQDAARVLEARGGRTSTAACGSCSPAAGGGCSSPSRSRAMPEHARLAFVTYCPTPDPRRRQVALLCGQHARDPLREGAGLRRGAARHAARPRARGTDVDDLLVRRRRRARNARRSTSTSSPRSRARYVIEASGAEERVCTEDDLREASEAFLASTTREVQPVSAIEDIELDGAGRAHEGGGGRPAGPDPGGAGGGQLARRVAYLVAHVPGEVPSHVARDAHCAERTTDDFH